MPENTPDLKSPSVKNVVADLDEALPTSNGESVPELETVSESIGLHVWLKNWGPWKRWDIYRQHKKHSLRIWQRRDSEENTQGHLPDSETIQIPAIWVAELYTPSTIEGLLKGIDKLGWEFSRSVEKSLIKWIDDVREGRTAGWVNLGLVVTRNAEYLFTDRKATLPVGVQAAYPVLMSLTPSITAFVIAFSFDDETAFSLDYPLREEFETEFRKDSRTKSWHLLPYILIGKPKPYGHRIMSPTFLRREAVAAQLEYLERRCVNWVKQHLPGAFASMPGSRTPTSALLVTEQVKPMTEEARKLRALEGLALSRDYNSWESDDWPGARLVFPQRQDGEGARLTFACRRQDAFSSNSGYFNPESNETIAQRAHDYIEGLLSRWAITCLLNSQHESLASLRDQTAQNSRYRPIKDLKAHRTLAKAALYDIGACTQEIVDFTKSESDYFHNVIEMVSAQEREGQKSRLLEELKIFQAYRARQVQRESELLQSTLLTRNTLTQTISNIRIQRLLVVLTLTSIGVAIWAAIQALSTAQ